jgi:hypothetical protein
MGTDRIMVLQTYSVLTARLFFSTVRGLVVYVEVKIIYIYIRMTHYKLFSVIILICKISTSFNNR